MKPDPDVVGKMIVAKPEVDHRPTVIFCRPRLTISSSSQFVIFIAVKAINSLKRKEAAAPAEPAAPTTDQKLLMEIRDLLAKE